MRKLALLFVALAGCASTPVGRVHQGALASKAFVDGMGESYLAVCTEVVRPSCVEKDRAAQAQGKSQTEADRVACLKPCDSQTAAGVHKAVGIVRVAQLVVWRALASGASDEEVKAADEDLKQALHALLELLASSGVDELMGAKNG